jgi:hypothetical protein
LLRPLRLVSLLELIRLIRLIRLALLLGLVSPLGPIRIRQPTAPRLIRSRTHILLPRLTRVITPGTITAVLTMRTACDLQAAIAIVIFVVRTLRATRDHDHPLRLETGPPRTPINWRQLKSAHGSQWATAHTTHAGDAPGVNENERTLLQKRLYGDRRAIDKLIISDSEIFIEVTRPKFMNVSWDVLNINVVAAAPA